MNSVSYPSAKTTRDTAKSLGTSIASINRKKFGLAKFTLSFFQSFMTSFRRPVYWIVFPLESCRTTLRAAFLRTGVTSINREKLFLAPEALSFFKGEMFSFSMSVMFNPMIMRSNYFKIAQSIVSPYSIFVMNMFVLFKKSADMFSHYISMFKSLYDSFKHRIRRGIYQNITGSMKSFPTFPIMMIFSGVNYLRNAVTSFNELFHRITIGQFIVRCQS